MSKLLQGKALKRYVREIADQMGLKDWRIDLPDELPPDDQMGNCATSNGQRLAVIRLADHGDDAEELRNTVVHELLHAHMMPLRYPLVHLEPIIGSNLYDMAYSDYYDHMETAVDGIATAWAETFPLPVKAKNRKG